MCVCLLASVGKKSWPKFGRFCFPCKVLPWICVCVSLGLWEKNLGLNLVGFVFLVKCFHGYVCVCLLASVGKKSWPKFGRFCFPCKVLPWICVCVSWPQWEKNLGLNLVGFVFLVKCFHGYVCVCVSLSLCGKKILA